MRRIRLLLQLWVTLLVGASDSLGVCSCLVDLAILTLLNVAIVCHLANRQVLLAYCLEVYTQRLEHFSFSPDC